MIDSLSYASEKSGMPPGSLVHVGDVHDHIQSIMVINYNASLLEKRTARLGGRDSANTCPS
jgi:magnesium transporter